MKQKILIKIGSNILTTDDGRCDYPQLNNLVNQMATLLDSKTNELVLVSSGAIICGAEALSQKPESIPEKQAAAAVGQIIISHAYASAFKARGYTTGQILLTKDGLKQQIKKDNIVNTLTTLLKDTVVPIINENDSVATDEIGIKFGDNDELSADVANVLGVDKLIILTDIDGVYTGHPEDNKSQKLSIIDYVSDDILAYAQEHRSDLSRGGMKSKLIAAKKASENGIEVIIADGRQDNVIAHILNGSHSGTTIKGRSHS